MYLGRANTDGDVMVWMPKQRVLIPEYGLSRAGALPGMTSGVCGHSGNIGANCRLCLSRAEGQPIDLSTSCAPLKPT